MYVNQYDLASMFSLQTKMTCQKKIFFLHGSKIRYIYNGIIELYSLFLSRKF